MEIIVLDESFAREYQALRLEALKTNPEAFGSTYERESAFSIEMVMERIKPTEEKFLLGALDEKDGLVGMVAFVRESSLKTSHKGNVYGMYVNPGYRGNQVGRRLLEALIKKAEKMKGLEQILLMVISSNYAAKKLYQSIGFEIYGIERNALKDNGEYWDEDLMVLFLKDNEGESRWSQLV